MELTYNLSDTVDIKFNFIENLKLRKTPGDSDIFIIFGRDSFGKLTIHQNIHWS